MGTVEITATAGVIAALVVIVGLAIAAIFRIGRLTEATERIPREMRAELQLIHERMDRNEAHSEERFQQMETRNAERFRRMEEVNEERFQRMEELILAESAKTQEQIRNLQQAIMTHSHDADGGVIFRVPLSESNQ